MTTLPPTRLAESRRAGRHYAGAAPSLPAALLLELRHGVSERGRHRADRPSGVRPVVGPSAHTRPLDGNQDRPTIRVATRRCAWARRHTAGDRLATISSCVAGTATIGQWRLDGSDPASRLVTRASGDRYVEQFGFENTDALIAGWVDDGAPYPITAAIDADGTVLAELPRLFGVHTTDDPAIAVVIYNDGHSETIGRYGTVRQEPAGPKVDLGPLAGAFWTDGDVVTAVTNDFTALRSADLHTGQPTAPSTDATDGTFGQSSDTRCGRRGASRWRASRIGPLVRSPTARSMVRASAARRDDGRLVAFADDPQDVGGAFVDRPDTTPACARCNGPGRSRPTTRPHPRVAPRTAAPTAMRTEPSPTSGPPHDQRDRRTSAGRVLIDHVAFETAGMICAARP